MVHCLTVALMLSNSDLPLFNYAMAIGDIGDLVYTPDANSESDDSFTFKVSDGTTDSASADTINYFS